MKGNGIGKKHFTRTHELAKKLLELPDQELFITGTHDHGIVRPQIRSTQVTKTGEKQVGEVLRIWEECSVSDSWVSASVLETAMDGASDE